MEREILKKLLNSGVISVEGEKVLRVNSCSAGIKSWGRLDYLKKHCGYRIIIE